MSMTDSKSQYGPNVTELITRFIACEAVPQGGGIADALEFFKNPALRKQIIDRAKANALAALRLFKTAPDNPFGDDEEAIAGYLLKRIEEKRNAKLRGNHE